MANCRDCNEEIIWLKTVNGKAVPINPSDEEIDKEDIYNPDIHLCHWETCPTPKEKPKAKCKDCDEEIVWLPTLKGKRVPIQPDSQKGVKTYNPTLHVCHWDVCKAEKAEDKEGLPF